MANISHICLENVYFPQFICLDNFISLSLSLKYDVLRITMYYKRIIDKYLSELASRNTRKHTLLRGARQVGKSSAVRHLGKKFKNFLEINFEMEPQYKAIFQPDLNVNRIVLQISAISGSRIEEGETLLFMDEIQECPEAISCHYVSSKRTCHGFMLLLRGECVGKWVETHDYLLCQEVTKLAT